MIIKWDRFIIFYICLLGSLYTNVVCRISGQKPFQGRHNQQNKNLQEEIPDTRVSRGRQCGVVPKGRCRRGTCPDGERICQAGVCHGYDSKCCLHLKYICGEVDCPSNCMKSKGEIDATAWNPPKLKQKLLPSTTTTTTTT
ncbi:unnamed protein product, partial [Meganyctiphanes norvegica]